MIRTGLKRCGMGCCGHVKLSAYALAALGFCPHLRRFGSRSVVDKNPV